MSSIKPILKHRSAGLTLVEILVILSILGMLAAISGNALMKYLPRADLKYAARTITSLCQHARMEAIKRNAPVALIFNQADQSCTMYIDSGDGDWSTLADNVATRRFALSDVKRGGVSFASLPIVAERILIFSPRGRIPVPDRTIVIESSNLRMEIKIHTSGSVRSKWI